MSESEIEAMLSYKADYVNVPEGVILRSIKMKAGKDVYFTLNIKEQQSSGNITVTFVAFDENKLLYSTDICTSAETGKI